MASCQYKKQHHHHHHHHHHRSTLSHNIVHRSMASAPHALLLPFPAQGHVVPLLELAYCLVDRGFKITMVNTEFVHDRVVANSPTSSKNGGDDADVGSIRLVSVPDGLVAGGDRRHVHSLIESMAGVMPGYLEELILSTNRTGEDKFTCFVADINMPWSFQVAKKTGLPSVAFWAAGAGTLIAVLSIPKLIEDGVIDEDGAVKKVEMMKLSPELPAANPARLYWNCVGDQGTAKAFFHYTAQYIPAVDMADFVICNSSYELEQPAFASAPKILPVGPLLTGHRMGRPVGHLFPEDASCLAWLDRRPAGSVVYVAFGSVAVTDSRQLEELALGLELSGRAFLWVVRPDLVCGGFRDRVGGGGRGRIVGWCPQQKVLAHPSIACFITHCGWNSTMEGVRNGVPFLCWPYSIDQFSNQDSICDVWRNGLRMDPDEDGTISREEIASKIQQLLGDEEVKARALALKEVANRSVNKGGSSFKNFNSFVDAIKEL